VRRLKDHPDVEDAWLEYLVNQLEPWAHEMRRWQDVQRVYERVDFMRRRLEEAEERYEVLLAVGLLQWWDPTAVQPVKRHLLTAPAEVSLDAARGVLTAAPAASFEKFWIELNMWISSTQPRLDGAGLDERLEELDVQVWDRAKVGEILRVIANRASPDAQVDESAALFKEACLSNPASKLGVRGIDCPYVTHEPSILDPRMRLSITIELKPEVERALAGQAAARGMEVPAYAATLLGQATQGAEPESQSVTTHPERQRPPGRKNLADLFAESPLKGSIWISAATDPPAALSIYEGFFVGHQYSFGTDPSPPRAEGRGVDTRRRR